MVQEPISAAGNRRVAMLIDGDNAQPSLIDTILAETGKYGIVTIRRIYGDWTTANMKQWKDTLHVHAIQPIQQFRYTTGKNATDSALIIDAMDILYEGATNGFCIVSSDSDYTRLATRIREKGLFVMGIGRTETPKPFVNACEVFVYTENLAPSETPAKAKRKRKGEGVVVRRPSDQAPLPLLGRAFEMAVQDDGWASLGTLGTRLRQLDPSFDSRTYGHRQLSLLIRSFPETFEIREVKDTAGSTLMYAKPKE
jgi:uncharacterized LabA/DUF88 family protein